MKNFKGKKSVRKLNCHNDLLTVGLYNNEKRNNLTMIGLYNDENTIFSQQWCYRVMKSAMITQWLGYNEKSQQFGCINGNVL